MGNSSELFLKTLGIPQSYSYTILFFGAIPKIFWISAGLFLNHIDFLQSYSSVYGISLELYIQKLLYHVSTYFFMCLYFLRTFELFWISAGRFLHFIVCHMLKIPLELYTQQSCSFSKKGLLKTIWICLLYFLKMCLDFQYNFEIVKRGSKVSA